MPDLSRIRDLCRDRNLYRTLFIGFMAFVAGIVFAGAYAPFNVWVLAPLALSALIALQWKSGLRVGFISGFAFGFSSFFAQHFWLGVVGTDAHWLLSLYLALWIAIVGVGTAFVSNRAPTAVAAIIIVGLWVTEEALRGRYPFGGYPWARVVFSQADGPFASWATLAGVSFVTAVVVGCATVLAILVRAPHKKNSLIAVAFILVAIVVPRFVSVPIDSPNTMTIAVIQGGTPQTGLGAMDVRRAVLNNHVNETVLLASKVAEGSLPQPDLVLWPENSSDINPYTDANAYGAISTAAEAVNAPILVGAVVDSVESPETEVYNMGILWDPISGPGETYIKNAPVPFGEFIPFRSLLTQFISRYDRVPRDFAHGQEPGIFRINGVTLGDLICFEVAVDRVVNRVMDEGANIILVQTNNATYANSALPEQQLNIERMRAIEMGRSVVVAATTGISASIDATGEVIDILNDGEVGSFVYVAPSLDNRTPGSIIGPWLELAITLLTLGSLIGIGVQRRIRR
jgi:apolipoprotein N-acyltransferase